ncbi:hypothetical protein HRbin10_01875 [bacterium HR10]|nr:hypothetical protein HRbin10_01875 [bacterium HR10]
MAALPRVGRGDDVFGEGILKAEVVQRSRRDRPRPSNDRCPTGNGEAKPRAPRVDPSSSQKRPILILLRISGEELMALVELMVHPDDEHRPPLIAQERPLLLRIEPSGEDGEEAVLVRALDGAEEMRPILHDRSAHAPPILIAPVVGSRFLEDIARVEDLVPEEEERAPVQLVRPRLRDGRQEASAGQTIFGLELHRVDLELANGILREILTRLAHLSPRIGDAIHDEAVRPPARSPADVEVVVVKSPNVVLTHPRGEQS